ncbi:MAG: LysR substrate-binding domain-containing protein [Alcanivorax sp.]
MIRPKLRQLEYLLALDNEQSFSNAAAACNVTQSTLSAGIKDLENILGQQLVNRAGRSTVSLTAFGNDVAEQSRMILSDVDNIVARARQMRAPLSGILRLGIIPTIAPYFLPQAIKTISEEYPDLELQLHEDLSDRLIDQITKRQLDAAIMAFPHKTEGMETHTLFEEDFYLAAPKCKDIPDGVDMDDITQDELLLLEDGHCLRDHALAACTFIPSVKRKTFSATSLPTLLQMVGQGYGKTLLPEMVVKNAPIPDGIQIIPIQSPAPTREIGMVWLDNSPQRKELNALAETLETIQQSK